MASQIGNESLDCPGIPRRNGGRVVTGPDAIDTTFIGELSVRIVGSILTAPAGDPDCAVRAHLDVNRIERTSLAQGHAASASGMSQNLEFQSVRLVRGSPSQGPAVVSAAVQGRHTQCSHGQTECASGCERGGHVDVTILGAFEVSVSGDLANWDSGAAGKAPLVGGAMDLAVSAKTTWVLMQHNTKDNKSRLVKDCLLPLTAKNCVERIYTDIAVIDVTSDGFLARELISSVSEEELRNRTTGNIKLANDCCVLKAPNITS